jgi:hypothetical protein
MSLTGEQLRDQIDSGRTGEKVGFPDPATVPLGTDAEAGGTATVYPAEDAQPVPQPKERRYSAIALFLALGFAVNFCIFVSVLIGAT